ncbi:MAG: hypothetical protein KatS3mg077_2754 [Candidatus Binatia bacterium]|nr:MAG: hypothetical protein KatS3mg077_2754 [Candidatus Binatia bacterium]
MSRTTFGPRACFVLAGVLPLVNFFVPLWGIRLYAPQYPEGISMYIWTHRITGQLDLVNGLNHYIGMKPIDPAGIPELRWMPLAVVALSAWALMIALVPTRALALLWVVVYSLLGLLGLVDFYLWEYDYGHNLDPTAPIKIPGMSYQPPLIGSKELLNFTAVSFPHVGGVALMLAGALGICGLCVLWRSREAKPL